VVSKGSSASAQGNVGVGLLRHFRVTVDMATPRLWLAQQVPFRDRKNISTYGLSLNVKGQDVVIQSLDVAGPAAKVGLKKGDVVSTINGMPARLVLSHLAALFADPLPGEQIHLSIWRHKKKQNATVVAELIP
jgi:S1-C subfamily serine protease